MSKIVDKSLKKLYSKESNRKKIEEKCGKKAFLDPAKLEFPITKSNCEPDCGLLFAAYLRAKEWKKTAIAKKAEDMYDKMTCEKKIKKKIHESLDVYTTNFALTESINGVFAGNSYIISSITNNILRGAVTEMKKLTENFDRSSISTVNAVNKSVPFVTLEFESKSALQNAMSTFISEQKNILEGNIILPVKGTMFMDAESVYRLDSSLKESFTKFIESSKYVIIRGEFQNDLTEGVNKLIDVLSESTNYVMAGIV